VTRFFAILAALSLVVGAARAQSTAPSIEDYAALSNMSSVSISPDGQRVAFISGETRAERSIVVFGLDGSGSNVIDGGDDQVVVAVTWVSNDRLAVTYSDRRSLGRINQRGDVFRTLIVRSDGTDSWELSTYANIANLDLSNEDSFLVWLPVIDNAIGSRARGGDVTQEVGLFRQGTERDRDRDRVFLGNDGYQYALDTNNEPLARIGFDDGVFELWSRHSGSWERVYTERLEREVYRFRTRTNARWTGLMTGLAGLDVTGRYAYFASRDTSRRSVYRYDFEANEIEGPLIESDVADVSSFIRDWRNNAVIGVSWEEERTQTRYFDPVFADLQTQLEGLFPASNVSMSDYDADLQRIIVHVVGGETAGAYYLLDRTQNSMSLLAPEYPRVPDTAMSPVEIVNYVASDGLDLFGYLTLPAGREPSDLPFIMLPHGGPESRDSYGYDTWPQFLASRGYAVFQPQFRGSSGFGTDFVELGHGEWGRAMQSDLDDAIDHLVGEGIVDPDRTCIFGWSYGGYAALAGATLTPGRYRCVIAGAPVSDILEIMEYSSNRLGGGSEVYWAEYIGNYIQNREAVLEISPVENVRNIQAPVMLIHGTDDLIVPFEQAELMAEAMDRAGKPYEMVRIEDGPHQSYRMTASNQEALFTALERFLLEHNPPDAQ